MMKGTRFAMGTRVKALRGNLNTMNPEPRFVGQVGTITKEHEFVGGEWYYRVDFDNGGHDMIDACNLMEMRV